MLANVGNGLAYRGWHFMACLFPMRCGERSQPRPLAVNPATFSGSGWALCLCLALGLGLGLCLALGAAAAC